MSDECYKLPGLLDQFLAQPDLSDCVIVCQDGKVQCHSTMLLVASPMWRRIMDPVAQEESSVTLLLPDFSCQTVTTFLEILYRGGTSQSDQAVLQDTLSLVQIFLPQLSLVRKRCLVLESVLDSQEPPEPPDLEPEMTVDNVMMRNGYRKYEETERISCWEKENEKTGSENISPNILAPPPEPALARINLSFGTEKKKENKSCQECGKTFLYPKDLKKHMLVHMKIYPLRCKICQKGVRTTSNMYKHLRQSHFITEDLKSYILDDKGNVFIEQSELLKKKVAEGKVNPEYLSAEKIMERGSVGKNKNGVNLYQCLICDKSVTKYSLKNHLSVHTGADCYKCELCPKTYYTKSALLNHNVNHHQDQKSKVFKCSNCSRTFRSVLVRDHHQQNCVQSDSSKRKAAFECRICNKIFGYKNNLVSHQKALHGFVGKKILQYECKYCKETIKGKLKLSKHIISQHPDAEGDLCDLCGKSFKTETKLMRHIAVHKTRERNLHCSFCPKKFFRKDILTVHEKLHTNPLVCTECGKKFPEQRYLDSHKVLHAEKKFECEVCQKMFATQELLKKHAETHSELKSHICKLCLKGFRTKVELSKHQLEHSNVYPLRCEICEKGFLHDSQLEKHVDTVHNKSSKLVMFCQHCPSDETAAKFSSLYSLKRHLCKHKCPLALHEEDCQICRRDEESYYKLKNHIRTNQSRKVLPCKNCNKMFRTVQELNVHSVVHSGSKPFSCDICQEKFTQKSSLKTHYLRHKAGTVGSKSYSCSQCGKLCKTFAALKSHSKSHEKEEQGQQCAPDLTSPASPLPQLIFQPDLLSLDPLSQIQVTTINIGALHTERPPEDDGVGLVATLVGEAGEYKIQIIDDLSNID